MTEVLIKCQACGATGVIPDKSNRYLADECAQCDGTGKVFATEPQDQGKLFKQLNIRQGITQVQMPNGICMPYAQYRWYKSDN